MTSSYASELPRGRQQSAPPVPLIFAVSGEVEFVERCREAADVTDALVIECDIRTVKALADKWRPIAIVVPEAVYYLDPKMFERVARRDGSRIIRVPGNEVALRTLEREFLLALRQGYPYV